MYYKKKEIIKKTFPKIENNKIIIVIKEIESWYFAGLNEQHAKELKIRKPPKTTNTFTKEQFQNRIPKRFLNKTALMQEILKHFDMETARKRNSSFDYFCKKYLYINAN